MHTSDGGRDLRLFQKISKPPIALDKEKSAEEGYKAGVGNNVEETATKTA